MNDLDFQKYLRICVCKKYLVLTMCEEVPGWFGQWPAWPAGRLKSSITPQPRFHIFLFSFTINT